jgi:ABC-type transporter Mla subunit MlaD
MADTPRPDPFSDVISLVAGPIAAVIRSFDQLRRGAEELMKGLENFNATMENLNDTAGRVNRLLNDFEEPIRAMLPQLTRTVKLADELSARLSGPIDQVAPGLARLADTLNSPVLMALPTDLGAFLDIINDLSRRMSPLAQVFEQAGGLFGMRFPGMPARSATPTPAPPPPRPDEAPAKKASAKKAPAKRKRAPAKKAAPRKSAARRSAAR